MIYRLQGYVAGLFVLGVLLAAGSGLSCFVRPGLSVGQLHLLAHAGISPLAGAHVRVWLLDDHGNPVEPGNPTVPSMFPLELTPPLAEGTTDVFGLLNLNVGQVYGTLLIIATGGSVSESWAEGGMVVESDLELRAVLVDFVPYENVFHEVTISPFTTVAAALGEARLRQGSRERLHSDAMRRAYAMISKHFDEVDIVRGHPKHIVRSGELGAGERHFLVLAALSSLGKEIAAASGHSSGQAEITLELIRGLIADAAGEQALLDGVGPQGPVSVASCVRVSDCSSTDGEERDDGEKGDEEKAKCKALCDLDANTWRSDLSRALVFEFLPSRRNQAGLNFEDVRVLVEALAYGEEPELFGLASVELVRGPPPVLAVERTILADEARDSIAFTDYGAPIHEPSGEVVELGREDSCPAVRKYVHRMDDPGDNALRWSFRVQDLSGAGIREDGGVYRVRLRESAASESLTDWLPAPAVASMGRGVRYDVVLLRSEVPELGTRQGIFEVEFRGVDGVGTPSPIVRRCWEHVPLGVPLELTGCREATGVGSMHAVNLYPANNLAPYLNGVSLEQGLALLECTFRNGTAERAYLSLDIAQAVATYTKSWQKTNAGYGETSEMTTCHLTGDCVLAFSRDRRTTISRGETGSIDELANGLLIRDMMTNARVLPCWGCDENQYLIEPRLAPGLPREYRLQVVVADLAALAPQPLGESWGPFVDTPMDPYVMPTPITGRSFGQISRCSNWDESACYENELYVHYLALVEASLSLEWLRLTGRISPALDVPPWGMTLQPGTFGMPIWLTDYEWATREEPLAPPHP